MDTFIEMLLRGHDLDVVVFEKGSTNNQTSCHVASFFNWCSIDKSINGKIAELRAACFQTRLCKRTRRTPDFSEKLETFVNF